MKCPYCGHTNDWDKDQCLMCGRVIAYLRDRVLLGQQFAFFEASEEQPILVTLIPPSTCEEEEHRFTRPTIVSRHEYGVRLERRPVGGAPRPEKGLLPGPSLPGPVWRRDPHEPFELPALDFPRLDLMAVTTDRKVYRVGDKVHIFIAAPDAAGGEVALEVMLDEQEGSHQVGVKLNQAGLGLTHLAGLEAGEYSVVVSLPDRSGAKAKCRFTCADLKLSALTANLESRILRGTQLSVVLDLTRHAAPYNGPVELVVRNAGRVVYQGQAEARAGRLEADLPLEPLTLGDVTLEVTTPEEDVAILPGLGVDWQVWDKIPINALDPPVEAATVPFPDADGEIRGLYYGHKSDTSSPFRLERLVGTEGRIQACRDVPLAHLLVFDPLSGEGRKLEFEGLKAGDVLRFEVGSPYAVFVLGAFMGRALPYEAWGVVMRPVELGASLDAPEEAAPGASVSVRVLVR